MMEWSSQCLDSRLRRSVHGRSRWMPALQADSPTTGRALLEPLENGSGISRRGAKKWIATCAAV